MSDQSEAAVEHLVCTACDTNPTIARRDGRATVVCHCTHDDGPLDGVPLNSMALLPDPWEYVATDGGGRYRCHETTNDVATLLLTDPLFNDRLRQVMDA